MRKATDIERILCDMRDLCVYIKNGNVKITATYFDDDDDLIIETSNEDGSINKWTIGFYSNEPIKLILTCPNCGNSTWLENNEGFECLACGDIYEPCEMGVNTVKL